MTNWLRRLAWVGGSVVLVYFANFLASLAFGNWAGPLAAAALGIVGYSLTDSHWDA